MKNRDFTQVDVISKMKLDIGYYNDVIALGDKQQWLTFSINLLTEQGFAEGIDWDTQITERLTLEEMIGSLVYAAQKIASLETALDLAEKRGNYLRTMWEKARDKKRE